MQGTAEGAPFSREEMDRLLALASKGIAEIVAMQKASLALSPGALCSEGVTRLVIASNNEGKLRELSAILGPLGFETVPQGALGVPEAEEPHHTFVENALAKARNCARHTGLAALADDSGLCVDALGGAPGVHSAYFAGRLGTREERDRANNALLVEKLAGRGRPSAPTTSA